LYVAAGTAFAASRLPRYSASATLFLGVAFTLSLTGLIWHVAILYAAMMTSAGLTLSIANSVSFIGLQLALIAMLGALEPTLRGLAGGLLILAGLAAVLTSAQYGAASPIESWQLQAHILISLFAYGLLSVGAIVALYALIQDSRLRAGKLTEMNNLFAPLETNERLLYGIATGGFVTLLIGVLSGFTFVDNLFAQHLVHKSTFSLIALALFGLLIAGRQIAGWRGRRAVYLYLWGFAMLGLAYFGSRFILEEMLGRTWG